MPGPWAWQSEANLLPARPGLLPLASGLLSSQHLESPRTTNNSVFFYSNKVITRCTTLAVEREVDVDEMFAQSLIDRFNLIDTGNTAEPCGQRVGEEVETQERRRLGSGTRVEQEPLYLEF